MPETGRKTSQEPQKGCQPGRFHTACVRERPTSEFRRIAADLHALK